MLVLLWRKIQILIHVIMHSSYRVLKWAGVSWPTLTIHV